MRRDNPHGYWFWAKRYGYGWGAPASWQGWLLLLVNAVPLVLLPVVPAHLTWVVLVLLLLTTVTTVLGAQRRGEPAQWRWGDDPR